MKNQKFFLFILLLSISLEITHSQSKYHSDDKVALSAFLIQETGIIGKQNWQMLLPDVVDEPNWNRSDDWVDKLVAANYLVWDKQSPARLVEIDFSWGGLSGVLDLRLCLKLTQLVCKCNSLVSLNVSGLSSLQKLLCNANRLSSLDCSGLSSLTELDCSVNKLVSLNVAGLSSLIDFSCAYNILETIDLSGLTLLTNFSCAGNDLTTINFEGLSSLKQLDCHLNLLDFLDVTPLSKLTNLSCGANLLKSLDVSALPLLEALDCRKNQISLSQLPKIKSTYISYLYTPQHACLSERVNNNEIDLSANYLPDGKSIFKWYLYADTTMKELTAFSTTNGFFQIPSEYKKETLICKISHPDYPDLRENPLNYITGDRFHPSDKSSLKVFLKQESSVAGRKNWEQLLPHVVDEPDWDTDESWLYLLEYAQCVLLNADYPTTLRQIYFYDKRLGGSLDLKQSPGLIAVNFERNKITSLDVSGSKTLKLIWGEENMLTSINLSGSTSLEGVDCYNNLLTSLDISGLPFLDFLDCSKNKIPFSQLPQMKTGNDSRNLYFYAPQGPFEGDNTNNIVDLTSQLYNGKTEFKWYKSSDFIQELTDIINNNGVFTIPSFYEGDTLICHISNTDFPQSLNSPSIYSVYVKSTTVSTEHVKNADNKFSVQPGNLLIESIYGGELRIFTLSGMLYIHRTLMPGTTSIPLPKDVYIVAINNETHKIVINN
ncbi:MAG: hypothetical protein LBH58_08090 [Tannerellaceae bacterium]|jgi:hypothetical protein|nr:hypothetical protein [Tannerellaceae bacterium]